MQHQAFKVRLYPTVEQQKILSQHFGCARWWWNYALNLCIETYKTTGKGLSQSALNTFLPKLKKQEETQWLSECYSQVLQATTLNLVTAYKNFFEGRAKYPRFKAKKNRQSIQYPQSVKVVDGCLKFPGRVGTVKAKLHRPIEGAIKTVTLGMTPSGRYYASVLMEMDGNSPTPSTDGKVAGIDLGLKDFAIVNDGVKTSKYANPKHLAKHERNLKRKQQKLARKEKGSKSRDKARRLVARVHERVSNVRTDYLHKLSRKLVDDNQVIVVESLNTKGMVRNHKLAKAISDVGWGMFVNFLSYKLDREGKVLVEIDRWFPSSKLCSTCHYQISEMSLDVRTWICPSCGTHHDRDGNAAINIRAEGIRMLSVLGTRTAADGGDVSPKRGRKSKLTQSPMKSEAHAVPKVSVG
ncbi:MAG TPA: RNA-guided endonuclease TnpB family protein [Stenomitos sp.]|uniref:IS200/IS605 family element transposase accessory protein TnpB n=1 Tax=Aerosakkonema funiforme FACHB-1375 TaxID=2949571 RepID=A0A926VEU6_9CYAN|nr:RNA-guided endonuclease TnpB family protein [Aerosakkonema funiforme]MBD2182590.1 IS200/IS605 family element transposase accessory protein TnpB [Aerosakkonema funiforme FACHB-1375]